MTEFEIRQRAVEMANNHRGSASFDMWIGYLELSYKFLKSVESGDKQRCRVKAVQSVDASNLHCFS